MPHDPVTAALELGTSLVKRLFKDPAQQAAHELELQKLAQEGQIEKMNGKIKLMLGQLEINKTEAQHKSIFVAGWRPAVGWVCVSILAFNFIGVYLLELAASVLNSSAEIPERMDMSELWPVLLGMLGIGAQRSYDKKQGTQTNALG